MMYKRNRKNNAFCYITVFSWMFKKIILLNASSDYHEFVQRVKHDSTFELQKLNPTAT